MKITSTLVVTFMFVATLGAHTNAQTTDWHHWRGPGATGVLANASPPLEWSEDKNILWKVPIEGEGIATPVISGDKVFMLTSIKTDRVDPDLPKPEDQPKENFFNIKKPNAFYQFVVMCLDRNNGKELWRKTASELIPHEGVHQDNKFASASPVIDGDQVYCWFGSAGLFCYDFDGTEVWKRDFGRAFVGSSLGEGASPVIHDGKLILLRDTSRKPKIWCLDSKTGKTVWEKERDEQNTWATPLILHRNMVTQVITTGSNFVRSYNLDNGEIIWQCSGLTGNCIPCPIVKDNLVFCMSGYKGYSLLAIDIDQKGNVTDSNAVVWRTRKGTPYIPSPVLYDGLLYFVQSNSNILSVLNSENGEAIIERTRIPGIKNVYASPIGAAGRIYVTGRGGKTVVLEVGKEFKVLATNQLSERIDASAAVAGNQIFLRGEKSLYCIGE